MQVVKRVLVVTRHVGYSINLKESLERDGRFAVTSFASAQNALSFLSNSPQDVALIDFTIRDMSGERIVEQIRLLQPDIGIVVSPNHPSIEALVKGLNVQAVVDLPMPIRSLVNLLETAIQQMFDSQPDTRTLFPITDESETVALSEQELEDTAAEEAEAKKRSEEIFQRLLAEEPPIPSFEESATLNDLKSHITNATPIVAPESIAPDDETPQTGSASRQILATQILESALDTSTPIDNYNAESFMERVTESQSPSPYASEPDFFRTDMIEVIDDSPLDYTATTTLPSKATLEVLADETLETDRLTPIVRSRPAVIEAQNMPASLNNESNHEEGIDEGIIEETHALDEHAFEETSLQTLDESQFNSSFAEIIDEEGRETPTLSPRLSVAKDPRIAQMALGLTRMSLELMAEALILMQGDDIVAYSGQLPLQEIEEIKSQLLDALSEEGQPAQINFITMPNTGADYMLYSQRTAENLVLSLLFIGTTPLGAIRRQGKRLVEALASVPEPTVFEEPIAELDEPKEGIAPVVTPLTLPTPEPPVVPVQEESSPQTLAPYSFVWILRNPEAELTSQIAQKLVVGIDSRLNDEGWKIYNLDVYEDFIYLRVDAPDAVPPQQHVRQLMQLSAQIAQSINAYVVPETLWSDSYLIMPSAREMNIEEIQEFINFVRE